uniref:Uncharacterized protein n=1 Tax=Anguilla anguilla TaxID=7936 RepID=A0A0E9XAT9_ANGAN
MIQSRTVSICIFFSFILSFPFLLHCLFTVFYRIVFFFLVHSPFISFFKPLITYESC